MNIVLDAISFKYNPTVYNKLRALNEREAKEKNIFHKLAQKYLGNQDYRPSVQERFRLFLHYLKWYYTRL